MMDVEDFFGLGKQSRDSHSLALPMDTNDNLERSDKEIFMKLLEAKNPNQEMSLKINKEMYDAVGQAQLLAISILLNRNAKAPARQIGGYRQSKVDSPVAVKKRFRSTSDFLPTGQYPALNQRNRPWHYHDGGGGKYLLDDLDCIFLETIYQRRAEDPNYQRNKTVF